MFRDRAGQVRFASLIGTGVAENGQYQDVLRYLDEAISLAKKNSGAAYPSVAINAKIEALRGLERFPEALTLCADAMGYRNSIICVGASIRFLRRGRIFLRTWQTCGRPLATMARRSNTRENWALTNDRRGAVRSLQILTVSNCAEGSSCK